MSGSAMSLTAAASGFLVFLLSVQVIQCGSDWGVTYTHTQICAMKGSTVEIRCRYRYPSGVNTTVERTLWFTKLQDGDLRAESKYAGRVEYHCDNNDCTLTIKDLRESDSAEYKFRFITNQPGWRFTGSPGVTLSVTGFQVQSNIVSSCVGSCKYAKLSCHSSCHLTHHPSYNWYENGKKINRDQESFNHYFYPEDSYSCAPKGYEDVHSPLVCVHGQSCNRVTYTDKRICAFKGSSVDISCSYNSYEHVTSNFWFRRGGRLRNHKQPEDLSTDSQYASRVQVKTRGGRSTLKISDLRESDSAEYHFKFRTPSSEWESSLPGTTLTVTDPDLQVQVIWSPTGPKLICHSSCLLSGRSPFVWYKNETKIREETSFSYGGYVDPADSYSCGYQNYHSLPVYAPKVPSLLTSFSGDIMKDELVILTCSSDANPAAKYTWYKKNQTLLSKEPQLIFRSIQSSDSGEYNCAAENGLGRRTSEYVFINVRYAPKPPSLSVSPSAEIVEGSSVTLTCSSDANPAATYTWYKENKTLLEGQEGIYTFTSISSEDSGSYHCKSENQYGQISSTPLVLDVQYAPRLPSVSVSPSAEIVEGRSVNLTCSSDANPAANYTWYKENEDSPKASGQIFTITDFRAEHSGNYYCEAQNSRGRHRFTIYLTVGAGAWKLAVVGAISFVLLAILALLVVLLWIRKKSLTQQSIGGERPDNGPQLNMAPVYDVPSAAAQRQPAEQQDELHYSSISFPQNQEEALYSNVRPAQPLRQTQKEEEEDGVVYTDVKSGSASGAQGARPQEDGEDLFKLYSTVKK